MAFFNRKKAEKRPDGGRYAPGIPLPPEKIPISSREYRIYRKKDEAPLSWYEMIAGFSNRIFDVSIDKSTEQELAAAIDFTGMRISPRAPIALMLLTIMIFSFSASFLFALGLFPSFFPVILVIVLGLGMGYYFLRYPLSAVKSVRIKASSEVVLAILYAVVSMRISPNLERALRFTASNISGPLAWDMRRLLWDIEMGKYYSANEALTDYIAKWKPENEEFSEALRLIRESQKQIPEKSEKTLDEALNVVLEGTKVRMRHYAQDLRTPVTLVHMMGIVLPVLGSVMAPMAAVFLSEVVSAWHFALGYDIILPLILLWFIGNILSKRPVTFSKIDISRHPDLPPPGSFVFRAGKSRVSIPVLPIALLIGLIMLLPAIYYFAEHPEDIIVPQKMVDGKVVNEIPENANSLYALTMSIVVILGISFSMAIFFILSNIQRARIEKKIYKMESEFELALFQLGNRISGGTPIELALEKAIDDLKDMEIANLFRHTLMNMKTMGMTLEDALMHEKVGSLKFYPSSLIRNVMRTITDTAKRGVQYASESMLTVSRYMRSVRETQEYMREILSETTSSMQFQAYALAPLVSGLIVSMSQIIIQVLTYLGQRMNDIGFQEYFGIDAGSILGNSSSLTPSMFQLIVGFYLIEVIIILAIFTTKVNMGEDKIMQWNTAGKMLIVGMIIYFIFAMGSSIMFADLINNALKDIIS